jgi:hypothetical protein
VDGVLTDVSGGETNDVGNRSTLLPERKLAKRN